MGIRTNLLLSVACLLSVTAGASAQTPSTRGDVSGLVGWLGSEFSTGEPRYSSRWDSSFHGALVAGWHWTDHLKTEVDFGANTLGRAFLSEQYTLHGVPLYRSIHRTFSKKAIGIGQQYQFFRNAWFHPHLAAGAHVVWERRTDEYQPYYIYDPVARINRLVDDRHLAGPETDVTVRPYVAGGFKAYLSRRAFFRNDLRVAFKKDAHEALLRFGFGMDF